MRRRGFGACNQGALQSVIGPTAISDPNYYSANASNFANWLNWMQCETPSGVTPTLSPAQQALASQFGVDTSNLANSGNPGANVAAAAPVIAAATQQAAAPPMLPGGGQICPAWGCGGPAAVSIPTLGPTSVQAVGAAPSTGFSLSSIPWWGWGIAAVGAYFLFAGGK